MSEKIKSENTQSPKSPEQQMPLDRYMIIYPERNNFGFEHPLQNGIGPSFAHSWGEDEYGPWIYINGHQLRFFAGGKHKFPGFWYSKLHECVTDEEIASLGGQIASPNHVELIKIGVGEIQEIEKEVLDRITQAMQNPVIVTPSENPLYPGQREVEKRFAEMRDIAQKLEQIRSTLPKTPPIINQAPIPYTEKEKKDLGKIRGEDLPPKYDTDTLEYKRYSYELVAYKYSSLNIPDLIRDIVDPCGLTPGSRIKDILRLTDTCPVEDKYKLLEYFKLAKIFAGHITKDMKIYDYNKLGFVPRLDN